MSFPVNIKVISFSQVFDDGSILVSLSTADNVRHIFRVGYNQLLLMNEATSSAIAKIGSKETIPFTA
jgi:hypothetical protein